MKAKTIRAELRKLTDAWLASIEDEGVREVVAKNAIITGGSIASMLLREPVNDYDVYFRTWEAAYRVARYYVARFNPLIKTGIACRTFIADGYGNEITDAFRPKSEDEASNRIRVVIKSAGIASEDGTEKPYEYFESRADGESAGYIASVMDDPGEIQDTHDSTEQMALAVADDVGKPRFRPVFMSSNAITLSHRVQLVLRFWGEPDKIHDNYDFVHCTNYWKSWDDELVLRPAALEALLARELRYVGSKYPICSLIRIRKFVGRGWSVNAGQILKACMQISKLDLTDLKVLEDQLTGVDAAYFCQVISRLKEKDAEKIDSAYLIEIVDRMF